MILHALKIPMHYRELIASLVCNTESRTCMLRLCDNCPPNSEVLRRLCRLVTEALGITEDEDESEFLNEKVVYHQWKSTDRSELADMVATRSDLIETVMRKLVNLIPHDFIAQKQSQYVREFKEDMPSSELKILMDFAMNFSCTYHKETTSYHFNKTQVTLHPVVIYHKTEGEEEVKADSICFISNDLNHDVGLVKTFQSKTISIVKSKFPDVKAVEYVTDGHGKALCDAMAGNIKRLLANKSRQQPENAPINSALKVYEFLKSHKISEKINFMYISKEESELERKALLPADQLVSVPGTRGFHCFVPLSENTIGCKRLSSDQNYTLKHFLLKRPQQQLQHTASYESGTYVVVKASGRRHVACLTDLNTEEQEAEVVTLKPRIPSAAGVYKWRDDLQTLIVPVPHIVCSVELVDLGNNSFKLTDSAHAHLTSIGVLK
ncbi:Dysferlin [Frankliniella fusca]|uniref:Dysferlin n=1 Tax=Frankliniella fusca TaxID=407009 RepID=A0AAE1LFB6_9NEOP|nr:Dysferlin [Frankliniella fusca]